MLLFLELTIAVWLYLGGGREVYHSALLKGYSKLSTLGCSKGERSSIREPVHKEYILAHWTISLTSVFWGGGYMIIIFTLKLFPPRSNLYIFVFQTMEINAKEFRLLRQMIFHLRKETEQLKGSFSTWEQKISQWNQAKWTTREIHCFLSQIYIYVIHVQCTILYGYVNKMLCSSEKWGNCFFLKTSEKEWNRRREKKERKEKNRRKWAKSYNYSGQVTPPHTHTLKRQTSWLL